MKGYAVERDTLQAVGLVVFMSGSQSNVPTIATKNQTAVPQAHETHVTRIDFHSTSGYLLIVLSHPERGAAR